MRTLSLAKGFPATTVDEVCAQAAVSKGSFYHHFATKEEMGAAALDRYFGDLVEALTTGPFTDVVDPVDRLHAFVEHAGVVCSGPLLRNGCLLGSFALDLAESHPEIRSKLASQFDTLAAFVAGLIDDAAGAAGIEVPAAALARQFLAVIEGSIVLAKAFADPGQLTAGVGLFADHLRLLFGREVDR
ncbi:MAG: TetR/AcrR family transcriptional regulator [Actinomycetota bacterium]